MAAWLRAAQLVSAMATTGWWNKWLLRECEQTCYEKVPRNKAKSYGYFKIANGYNTDRLGDATQTNMDSELIGNQLSRTACSGMGCEASVIGWLVKNYIGKVCTA